MRLLRFFITVHLFVFLFSACTGNLTGHVFLDADGDNSRDDGEPKIANLQFTVTRDDEELDLDDEDTQTDADGNFTVPLEGTGTYCVEVSEGDLTGSNSDGTSPDIVSAALKGNYNLFASPGIPLLFAETDCSDETDDDDDGDTDCDDSDCDEDDFCTGTETDCSDEEDNDGDGDTDCDDSDCDEDSSCTDDSDDSSDDEESDTTSSTTESGLACDESKGFTLELFVPIAIDYESGVSALEDPSTKTVSRGDEISLTIQYPESCEFDLISLPTSITPVAVPADSYDSTTGQFDFNEAIAAGSVSVSDPLSINQDAIATFELDVSIDQDGSLDSKTVTVTPTVSCPDDSTVTLKTHTIDIDSEDDMDVTQSMSGTVALGNTITVTTTITNNTSVDYDSDQVELTLVTPTLTLNQSYDATCSNLGESAECSFDIDGGEVVTLTTTFDLPDSLTDDTSFEMTATLVLSSDGSEATFEGDSVTFSLTGDGSGS